MRRCSVAAPLLDTSFNLTFLSSIFMGSDCREAAINETADDATPRPGGPGRVHRKTD